MHNNTTIIQPSKMRVRFHADNLVLLQGQGGRLIMIQYLRIIKSYWWYLQSFKYTQNIYQTINIYTQSPEFTGVLQTMWLFTFLPPHSKTLVSTKSFGWARDSCASGVPFQHLVCDLVDAAWQNSSVDRRHGARIMFSLRCELVGRLKNWSRCWRASRLLVN